MIGETRREMKFPRLKHVRFKGLPIAIETDVGQYRHWYDPNSGEKGSTEMKYAYGYFKDTEGLDGDEVDVFLGENEESDDVFIVTQIKRDDDGAFEGVVDEQKVMLGFKTEMEAKTAYLQHYNDARFFGEIIRIPFSEFVSKLKSNSGGLIKSKYYKGLIKEMLSARMKNGYSMEKATGKIDACDEEEADDLKKVSKGLEELSDLVKALRATTVASLSRRQKLAAAYQAGLAAGRVHGIKELAGEVVEPDPEAWTVEVNKSYLRPGEFVPVAKPEFVYNPQYIPIQKCEDHTYKSDPPTPQECDKPYWRR